MCASVSVFLGLFAKIRSSCVESTRVTVQARSTKKKTEAQYIIYDAYTARAKGIINYSATRNPSSFIFFYFILFILFADVAPPFFCTRICCIRCDSVGVPPHYPRW